MHSEGVPAACCREFQQIRVEIRTCNSLIIYGLFGFFAVPGIAAI